jgi:hypothetical protein
MQIRHKLSPALQAQFKQVITDLNERRRAYLATLGAAKEIELQAESARITLSGQLALIVEMEGLPKSIRPYALAEDCGALIGESEDAPAPALVPAIVPAIEQRRPAEVGVMASEVNGIHE